MVIIFGKKIILKNLLSDETPIICFCGTLAKSGFCAFAITNKRLIYGQDKIFGTIFKSVLLDKFNDITKQTGVLLADINFDFYKEFISVGVNVDIADRLFPVLNDFFNNLKTNPKIESSDKYDEIRKLKSLLDDGIITQEEFDKKKEQLLN